MYEFDNFAKRLVSHLLDYPHLIVFDAILQARQTNRIKECSSIDDIVNRTNMHQKDAMRFVMQLQTLKFVETCTTTINNKRVHIWGIKYGEMIAHAEWKLQSMYDFVNSQDNMVYCRQCQEKLNIHECFDDAFNIQCPRGNHDILHPSDFTHTKELLLSLMHELKGLENKTPRVSFAFHAKRCSSGHDCAT